MGIATKVHDKASILNSVVLSANDGIVTTFAVVAGSLGASLSPTVVIILGFANLFADGVSMSSGVYLGLKSELEFGKATVGDKPLKNALITLLSFVFFGFIPLISYVFKFENSFLISTILVGIALMSVGYLRSFFSTKKPIVVMLENLFIGGLAASVAYFVGLFVDRYII